MEAIDHNDVYLNWIQWHAIDTAKVMLYAFI